MSYSESFHRVVNSLCVATGLDREAAEYVMELFLSQSQEILNTIESILKREYTGRSLVDEDFVQMAMLFHKLKGSSGNVRAEEVMNACLMAEAACKSHEVIEIKQYLDKMRQIFKGYSLPVFF